MEYYDFFENKVVLVTGGAGAIGSNLVKRLIRLNCQRIIILDNLSSSYIWNVPDHQRVSFVKGDIRCHEDLKRVFRYRPKIIFHLAAFFANQNSVDYPLENESVNCNGLLELLEYSVISGNIERFIFTNSEGGAYGHDCELPYKEDELSIHLGTPYYISKLSGEAYCNYYHQYYDLPICNVRLFNSFGPGEVPGQYRNVIPNFIYWALSKKPLPLTGDERIARDFVFVEDTVEGILRSAYYNDAIGEAINIATGRENSIYNVAEVVNKKTKNKAGVQIREQRKWDSRISIYGDTQKCERILKFVPSTDFEKGLDYTIEWFTANWRLIKKHAEFPPGLSSALTTDIQ